VAGQQPERESPALSRYIWDEEHVVELKARLNQPSDGDGISVGPVKPGVCKIVLPLGEDLRQRIYRRGVGPRPDLAAD
jgi:hypothetical protein